MIEFKGNLTGAAKKYLLKAQLKGEFFASLATAIIFTIPVVIVALNWKAIALIMLFPLYLLPLFSIISPFTKGSQKIFMPKRIYIDLEEQTIVHECEKMERFHMLNTVKNVIDYGEWYHVVFVFSDRDLYFVCQKSLLTQGSLEEFEALFEDKIVRRI